MAKNPEEEPKNDDDDEGVDPEILGILKYIREHPDEYPPEAKRDQRNFWRIAIDYERNKRKRRRPKRGRNSP